MALSPGDKVAHYEIVGPIGAGGMGEVYRAHDTRLKREVAVKVLSPEFALDSARLSRFAREAQILASLNHPGIAAVYGLEGSALILELVEGPTLAHRPAPTPWDDALPILQQLIDAIEYAHEHGVVHRDLKPDNIKLTPDGRVKVLDFGLAKALSHEPGLSQNPADSPTLTMPMGTIAGVIMGTAAYMAPEQARGKLVDKRADIWAFGVVAYELLTAHRLFEGETVSDILAQTLTKQVDLQAVPPQARPLLRRCLDRDPRTRLRDIGDARHLLTEPAALAPASAPSTPPWRLAAAAAILLSAGLAVGLWLRSGSRLSPSAAPLLHFTFTQPDMAERPAAAISPDGKRIVYIAGNKLWLRDLESGQAKPLDGTTEAERPFWSPDSRTIGFVSESQVWRVGVNGEPAVPFARLANLGDGCFSTDGKTAVVYVEKTGLFAIPLESGTPRLVWKQPPEGFGFQGCSVLPVDGPMRWVISNLGATLRLIDLSSGAVSDIGRGTNAVYAPSGHLVFHNAGRIQVAPFSLSEKKFTGPVVELVGGGTRPQVSASGLLSFTGSGSDRTRLAIRDRKGAVIGTAGAIQPSMRDLSVSPNGRQIAVSSPEQGSLDIWLHETDRAVKTRLTSGERSEVRPQWSPDGKQLVYNTLGDLELIPADGSRAPEKILKADAVSDWSPDARFILHWVVRPINNTSFSTRSAPDAPWQTTPFLMGRFNQSFGKFSRDGRFVAYVSDESGEYEVYVRPFPAGPGKWRISMNGGVQPRWSRDGKELYYLDKGVLFAVPFTAKGDTFTAGVPQPLFDTGSHNSDRTNWKYDELPGGRFVVVEREAEALDEARLIHVITNWPAILQRKSAASE